MTKFRELTSLEDVVAYYDNVVRNAPIDDYEWDFVMTAAEYRVLRNAIKQLAEVRADAVATCELIASTGGSATHCVEAMRSLSPTPLAERRLTWIPVKERLPEKENLECAIAKGAVILGVFPWKFNNADPSTKEGLWLDLMEGTGYMPKDITHWMPLEPPGMGTERNQSHAFLPNSRTPQ